jgi:signal peptidase II
MIFTDSSFHTENIAILFPSEGAYGTFLHGKVVDMFYFPLFEGVFPAWIPKFGGEPFLFFRPVFNFADACISVGVASLILFQRSFFKEEEKTPKSTDKVELSEENFIEEADLSQKSEA